jgi:HAD superfamily hydrolase (TIGR01549 family)
MEISAIIWDYDGTLVDSTKKNMEVTIEVLKNFNKDIEHNLPEALTSVKKYLQADYKYKNWRDLYLNCYNLKENQLDEAGKLWSPYQLANNTTADLFPGLDATIRFLGNYKHGICSQNGSDNIRKTLKTFGISDYFEAIVGYADVSYQEQKPNPAGFIKCINMLNMPVENKILIYIGDHQEDVVFGRNAQILLNQKVQNVTVKSIAVDYSGSAPKDWIHKPDYIASSAEDIKHIITDMQK